MTYKTQETYSPDKGQGEEVHVLGFIPMPTPPNSTLGKNVHCQDKPLLLLKGSLKFRASFSVTCKRCVIQITPVIYYSLFFYL